MLQNNHVKGQACVDVITYVCYNYVYSRPFSDDCMRHATPPTHFTGVIIQLIDGGGEKEGLRIVHTYVFIIFAQLSPRMFYPTGGGGMLNKLSGDNAVLARKRFSNCSSNVSNIEIGIFLHGLYSPPT